MRNFQPDARCEEHNLVVEFDGLDHYETLKGVYMDKARDEWYGSLEYHVVHIPYWMPTGPSELSYLFGAHVSEGCELKLGIFGSPDSTYLKHGFGIGNSPATFCEQGALRFAEEFQRLPYETREMVMDDLDLVAESNFYGLDALPSCIASLRAWQRVHC